MKYLILSLVANLLVFGVLSAIGLNINILAAMMIVLVIPIMISGILFFKTNIDKTYIFFNIIFIVKSRLLCKMLYNVFTISTYQN
ncbi:Protein msa (Modulator of sarA) [Staphylococcus aureus]|nr:Protein msa (Modulator of sarA) [Staphylococcus aureus]